MTQIRPSKKPDATSAQTPEHGRSVSARAGKWNGREVVHARAPVEVLPPLDLAGLKLNLGAGWDGTDGFIRVDLAGKPDIILDVTEPLPFDDDTFIEVRAFHVLEHIDRSHLVRIMNECWRVLETPTEGVAGGVMEIEVPLFPSEAAMADPTHISFFVPATFDYFNKGGQFDGERMLYGIKPWSLTDRVRDSMNIFLRVRLAKLPNDLEAAPGTEPGRNVAAGMGELGTAHAPQTDPLDGFRPCCGAPQSGGHLGTCDEARILRDNPVASPEAIGEFQP